MATLVARIFRPEPKSVWRNPAVPGTELPAAKVESRSPGKRVAGTRRSSSPSTLKGIDLVRLRPLPRWGWAACFAKSRRKRRQPLNCMMQTPLLVQMLARAEKLLRSKHAVGAVAQILPQPHWPRTGTGSRSADDPDVKRRLHR